MPQAVEPPPSSRRLVFDASPVLIVDPDPAILSVAGSALRAAGCTVDVATDAESALTRIRSAPRPRIVLCDVTLEVNGAWVGAAIRRERPHGDLYLFALSSRAMLRDAGMRTIDVGADDWLTKPIATDDLLTRVSLAQRMLSRVGSPRRSLRELLREATRRPGGELVVIADGRIGRVYFHGGRVAWAHLAGRSPDLVQLFARVKPLTADDARSILDGAKASQQSFVDFMVNGGLISPAEAREAIREWLAAIVGDILALPEPQSMFIPATRDRFDGPTFAMQELATIDTLASMDAVRASSLVPPPQCQHAAECGSCAAAASHLEGDLREAGAEGLAIVHGPSGCVMGQAGVPLDPELVHAQISLLGSLASGGVDEVIVNGRERRFLARTTGCRDAFLCMMAPATTPQLGALRHELTRASARIEDESGRVSVEPSKRLG